MSQTSYAINMAPFSYPGQPADIGTKDDVTALAFAAAIPYGVLVVRDLTNSVGFDKVCGKVPALTTDVTAAGAVLGISVADQARPQDPSVEIATYPQYSAVPCRRMGRIVVLTEGAVTAGDKPFIRFASGGGGTQLGAFRGDADTASAVALPGATYVTTLAAAGFAVVQLTVP